MYERSGGKKGSRTAMSTGHFEEKHIPSVQDQEKNFIC